MTNVALPRVGVHIRDESCGEEDHPFRAITAAPPEERIRVGLVTVSGGHIVKSVLFRRPLPGTEGRGSGWRRALLRPAATGGVLAVLLGGAGLWALPAQAAVGDQSAATGQYLSGSLLGLDAALVASLGGEAAVSNGTADQTNANNLDVGALGAVTLTAPGGIQLPLDLGSAGVVGQYASALQDGSSVGASGLISSAGAIGTGITPAPGVAPGPLSLNLAQAVSSLGLPTATLDELSQLDLTAGVTAAQAAQAAPGAATGSYSLANVGLTFQSPTLAALAAAINTQVGTVQGAVDGLAGPSGTLATSLDALPIGGILTTTATVGASDLQADIATLLTGPITDPANPGVTIDLSTGTVTVDLGQLTALEGLAPGTELLSAPVIADLGTRISGVVGSLVTRVENTLTTTVDGLSVTAVTSLLGAPVVTVDSTIGQLLAGDTSGIALAGAGVGLPVGTVLSALTTPLTGVGTAISAIGPAVIAPVTSTLLPALDPVLSQVLSLTVNNQATTGGVFTETALRATVLPAAALTLDVANASVGPNAVVAAPVATSLTPDSGPEAGGQTVTITGSGFTGSTGVTFDGTPATAFTVVDDTTITATTPAHTPGAVDVVVQHPAGDSVPLTYTYLAAPTIASVTPPQGPQTGGTLVTITGTGFTGTTDVTFGGTPAASFTVVNDTTITATTPAHLPGAAGVVVTAPGGQSVPGDFTFLPVVNAPVITGLAPDHGPFTGGTAVTITGGGFTGATAVTVDGTPVPFTVVGDGTITIVTPPHAAGPVPVVVTSAAGATPPATFTYDPGTTVTGVTPGAGPESGGTTVTITGGCFTGAIGVLFGTTAARSFTVVDDATITAVSPAGTGTVGVTVVGSPACGAGTLPAAFVYTPAAGGTGTTGTGGTGSLASTGSTSPTPLLVFAGLLLLAGAALVIDRRRRRAL